MLQVDPTLTPDDIYQVMRDTAIDQGTAGYDVEWGYGILDAVGAIYKVWKPEPPQLVDDTGASQTDGLINVNRPTFTGTVPAGSYVEIFAGFSRIAYEQLPPGETTYSIQSARTLRNGFTYDITVRVSENDAVPVANRSQLSDPTAVKVDLTAPRITQVTIATTAAVPNPSFGIPTVASSGAQLTRVRVFQPNQVQITFDQDLADLAFAPGTLPALVAGDMQLFSREASQNIPLAAGVTYDPATRTATWTIATPITGLDQIELSLFDSLADVAGNKLDAEGWTSPDSVFDTAGNSTYPSGDGAAGGSLTDFRFTLMPGDVIGSGDNIINLSDFSLWQQNQGGGPNGDADFDGDVDTADYNLISDNFQIDYRYWPTGGTAMATAGGKRIDQETSLTGKPALRAALIDYYFRRITDPDASRQFDSLLGWHMFGDKQWWIDLLGDGWESKL